MILKRVNDYLDTCVISRRDREWMARGMGRFVQADPQGLTKFQFGYGSGRGLLASGALAMNIDGNAFSCKSPEAFAGRIGLFRKTWGRHAGGQVMSAAALVASRHPMDIYGGLEVRSGRRFIWFWLIYGGADKQGRVQYCPVDRCALTTDILRSAGCRMPAIWRPKAFHLALCHDGRDIGYEVYYEGIPSGFKLGKEQRKLGSLFTGRPSYFCSGELFDARGRVRQRRIFLYFPAGVSTGSREALRDLLLRIKRLGTLAFPVDDMAGALARVPGELNLFGFSDNGDFAMYLDTWKGYENNCAFG
ncbi:MAG: hypothetical protein HQL20_01830 [Candidatus Omnitrophica bacterium]|nr:hypothetical protein [Candidatus Omnitrophota bacterium]